jgi:hypothetical protein
MKTLIENKEVISQLEKYNIFEKDGRNWHFVFSGTKEECEERKENDEWLSDAEIVKNSIADQWENEVDGIGYVRFANDIIIDYPL